MTGQPTASPLPTYLRESHDWTAHGISTPNLLGGQEVIAYGGSPRRLAHEGDLTLVPPKRRNVLRDPLQGHALIEDSQVGHNVGLRVAGQDETPRDKQCSHLNQPAQCPQTLKGTSPSVVPTMTKQGTYVIDRHHNDLLHQPLSASQPAATIRATPTV
jgi:hypothetical protein